MQETHPERDTARVTADRRQPFDVDGTGANGRDGVAALFGIGVYGALSQQSFVMIMMGLELMINGAILAAVAFWAYSAGGSPKGGMLAIVFMTVMRWRPLSASRLSLTSTASAKRISPRS